MTLVAFVITNVIVLFPFHIPVYVPICISNAILDSLASLRVISRRKTGAHEVALSNQGYKPFLKLKFPMNFVTAPLLADLFLLAIKAIGRTEVHDGTIGANNISPIDIMLFFLTLAYIAISIDASGLIRWLAFKVLQWGGKVGHKLFFYLYAFFFALGSFIGNDPIILSGTAFLAYMTRVSKNINHPKAWIYSQFAVANIASAILVSSNPTNLVLAGAFEIKFIHYTANMIVPVVITAVALFPFLLYFVFADKNLIPDSIEMETLSEEEMAKTPINPNIPYARLIDDPSENLTCNDQRKRLPLEEIMNPFLDKRGAAFGAVIMATTLITLLALNAASTDSGEHPVFWVTLPAAFVMFCWDIASGWYHRSETRGIALAGRRRAKEAKAERDRIQNHVEERQNADEKPETTNSQGDMTAQKPIQTHEFTAENDIVLQDLDPSTKDKLQYDLGKPTLALLETGMANERETTAHSSSKYSSMKETSEGSTSDSSVRGTQCPGIDESSPASSPSPKASPSGKDRGSSSATTLVSLAEHAYIWCQDTFPTSAAVIAHLPFALVPFAFSMFVLVQALVTKGWVQVFAKGWDHWVNRTGTAGSIGGMGFLSVCLCNFAGTNIGTTILLSRVIQEWETLRNGSISDRTFWGTIYSMALGVNYGAFSSAFSASLAGLLWRDILGRKHIHVKSVEFARVNFPIIAIAMAVGCTALIAEVYIMRDEKPYKA